MEIPNPMTINDPLNDIEPTQPQRLRASDRWIIFDIESGSQDEEVLKAQMPEFTPAANLKDPEKIKADIEAKKARYLSQAALSPMTGKVVAVGILQSHGDPLLIHGEDEERVVREAVEFITPLMVDRVSCIGFNIHGFDLPFLRFRAMVHKIPTRFWTRYTGRAYWAEKFRDLLPELVMGRDFAGYNLDAVAKAFGLGGKTGDGAHFHETYKKDQKAALDYLLKDLEQTRDIAKRMEVIE